MNTLKLMVTTQFRRTITLTIMTANISEFTVTKSFFCNLNDTNYMCNYI